MVEKPDANAKLRQPTIMDVLRRAGAIENQEVSSAGSSGATPNRPHRHENESAGCNEIGLVDISEKPICLESQRFKFRPLLVDCLSILSLSEVHMKIRNHVSCFAHISLFYHSVLGGMFRLQQYVWLIYFLLIQ